MIGALQSHKPNQILSRLMRSLPAGTFEMETLGRLADIVITTDVATAAMECKQRPRLLINPDFVAKYCQRDEHLFLLVMHELWHVMLAHTSLYPRVTQAQNIAFDAIINATLLRRFSVASYRGFFEAINPADQFPHMLLRPPVGWHTDPLYPDGIGPQGTVRILKQLYPPNGANKQSPMPFYREILDLILRDLAERGQIVGVPMLLGNHLGNDSYANPYLRDAVRKMSEQWSGVHGLPSDGQGMNEWQMSRSESSREMRQTFARVLELCVGQDTGRTNQRVRQSIPETSGKGVLPNPYDRLIHARKQLGIQGNLWQTRSSVTARIKDNNSLAHIYLDVSGSMGNVLPYITALVLPFVASGKARVFQFSTEITHLNLVDLASGKLMSTGGTNIHCVTNHLIMNPTVNRALVLTDGYTGKPSQMHLESLKQRGLRLHVVLPSESPFQQDLQGLATTFTVLPALRH